MHSLKLHTSRYTSSYNVSYRRSSGSLRTKIHPVATSEYVGVTTPCGSLASGIHECFELQIGVFILAPSKLESTKLYMNVGSLFIIWSFACFCAGVGCLFKPYSAQQASWEPPLFTYPCSGRLGKSRELKLYACLCGFTPWPLHKPSHLAQ